MPGPAHKTHLFEDRVMKIGRVQMGAGVVLGSRSTVLYDSQLGDSPAGAVVVGNEG